MAQEYVKYEVDITAIIVKDGKYLITRRTLTRRAFPGKWTVPGGHLHPSDYNHLPKDAGHAWYNVLETALTREVKEEVGLEIQNVDYLANLAFEHNGEPSIVISCIAD